MNYLRKAIRAIIATSILSLSLVRPMIAQQEVSPDHFDAAPSQTAQASRATPRTKANKVASHKAAKTETNKTQRARTSTASSKKVSG